MIDNDKCIACNEPFDSCKKYSEHGWICPSCEAKTHDDHFICKECGDADRAANWSNGSKLQSAGFCFACNFWMEFVQQVNNPEVVRIDGRHYFIERANAGGFRGFGGMRYEIRFFDGRQVTTTNLWSQGDIPDRFKDRLPDNATFV